MLERGSSVFCDEPLKPSDHVKGYRGDDAQYRQDFASLLVFVRGLNDTLHMDKVAEGDRALLLSAILIALKRTSFRRAFPVEREPKVLAKMTVDAALESLRDAGVDGQRLDVIHQQFGFLLTSPILVTKPDELKSIIHSIEKNVNAFQKTHQYRDVLGSLYIEFLRHANSDKGLGIVLTPPHITELFADLAGVNAKSIIYDRLLQGRRFRETQDRWPPRRAWPLGGNQADLDRALSQSSNDAGAQCERAARGD